MYDRRVRRRRAVLAALVAASIVLLTVYFGESAGGGLHSAQRGALQVLGPIQEGASRALKPFRDLFNWVGDTVDAKAERDRLKKERDALDQEVADLQRKLMESGQLKNLETANTTGGLGRHAPVKARVIARSLNLFYSIITIDKGASAGVAIDNPVVSDNGSLVGRVTEVTRGHAVVTLITDEDFAAAARTLSRAGTPQQGAVRSELGSRGDLILDVEDPRLVHEGERIVTAGSLSKTLESYFPPNITIGKISRIDFGEGDLDRKIHVRPSADLRGLLWVEVLTDPEIPDGQVAQVTP